MIGAHGTYINDLRGKLDMRCITADEAVELIIDHAEPELWKEHEKDYGSLDPVDPNLMLNKAWICLRVVDDIVECLYKADFDFYVCIVKLESILERAKRDLNVYRRSDTDLVRWCKKQGLLEAQEAK